MRSTPLTSCSIGVATVSATILALAPGYVAVTWTVGGATSGHWAIGSFGSDTTPTITMTIDRTVAKIGRSMKKREITAAPLLGAAVRAARGTPARPCTCGRSDHGFGRVTVVPHSAGLVAAPAPAAAPGRIGSTG